MADLVTLTIDGVKVSVPKGTLIVDAAKRIENDIPVFCYHPKLKPVGMCRMCLVEVGRVQRDRATGQAVLDDQGQPKVAINPKLETACTTPVEDGMVVIGLSDKVKEGRDDIIEFLLTSHPLDCPICDKGGECPLQNLTLRHGPGQSRFLFEEKQRLGKHIPLGTPQDALIYLDRERCIQCSRCTRFCDDIADDHVLGFYERGRKFEIVTFSEPGFDSKFSGNTTDICPVGALTTADFRFGARPWEMSSAASICPHCPVGCNIAFSTRREAKTGGDVVVKRVLPRQNEQVNEIWMCDKGRFGYHFATSPDRLKLPLVRRDGELHETAWEEALRFVARKLRDAGQLVGVAGDRLSNEDLYNFRALVTALGGTVELNSPMGGGDLTAQVGVGIGTNLGTVGKGTTILVVASDLEEEAPIWWLRVKQAAERGATLIVANGRATKTDRHAKHQLRYTYGHEVATVLGLLNGGTPAADAFAQAENAIVLFGREGLDFAGSTALAQACAKLLIATNHYGKANNGLIGVWPQANTQGAWDLGVRPSGRSIAEVLNGFGAAWIVASDPVGNGQMTAAQKPGLLIVQDMFMTETAKLADVILPPAPWTDREGTFTSGERRVQRFYPVQIKGKADFQIFATVGAHLKVNLPNLATLAFIEIAKNTAAYAGLTYQTLAQAEKQWPDVGGRDLYYGGTSYTNEQGIGVQTPSGAERGETVEALAPTAATPAASPLTLVPTTLLYDRGTLFGRSLLLHPRVPMPYVELNSADAAKLGVKDGDEVVVTSENFSVQVTVRVDSHAPAGVALLPASLGPHVPAQAVAATVKKA